MGLIQQFDDFKTGAVKNIKEVREELTKVKPTTTVGNQGGMSDQQARALRESLRKQKLWP